MKIEVDWDIGGAPGDDDENSWEIVLGDILTFILVCVGIPAVIFGLGLWLLFG